MLKFAFYCVCGTRPLDDHEGSGYQSRCEAEIDAREELQWCDPERQKRDKNYRDMLDFVVFSEREESC